MVRRLGIVMALLLPMAAQATSDPFEGLIDTPSGAAVGIAPRIERSPYRGAEWRHDFLPLYLYEGERLYLHGYRAGLRLGERPRVFELFLKQRAEGFPYEDVPASLAGMARREPGVDAGLAVQQALPWGEAYAELLRDISATSKGTELRLGWQFPWRSGRLRAKPHATLAWRNARLNDYYYGVAADEASALRPRYAPGAGADLELGVVAAYSVSERWRLLAGASAIRADSAVRASPIVEDRTQYALSLGLLYDFSPEHEAWPAGRPLIARAFHGDSSDCILVKIATLRCTERRPEDGTVTGFEIGRPFIDRVNNWPLDLAGFVGFVRHDEHGRQEDFWQVNAYVKAYWYGFPWDSRVRTRVGIGSGLSYARRVPFAETRDQAIRGRDTSKLLLYLDPTVDVSIGDLAGIRRLRETYVGLGISHRSGVFGTSRLLGNVDGGSNYIYAYVETSF